MSVPTKLHFDFDVPVGQNIDAYVTVTYGDFTIRGFMVVDPPKAVPYVHYPRVPLRESSAMGPVKVWRTLVTVDDNFERKKAFEEYVLHHWRDARKQRQAQVEKACAKS